MALSENENFEEGQEKNIDEESEDAQSSSEIYTPTKQRGGGSERRSSRQLWLISYSDFMTILMIFFLAMYGYTYLAKMKILEQQNKKMTYSEFSGKIQSMQQRLGDQVKVQDDLDKVTVRLADRILFASGSANLNPVSLTTLDDLANSLKLVEGDIVVEGHTDNVPVVAGHFKSNWELSAARAFSVIQALTKQGVPPQRLAAWGFGETRPVADNSDEEHRAQNRRIEVVILKKKSSAA